MKTFILLAVVLLFASCSNFEKRWTQSVPHAPDALAGKWAGGWASNTGHRGDLRAIVLADQPEGVTQKRPANSSAARLYHATFKATFWSIFTAVYDVDFTATATFDGETFTGDKNLGPFAGGNYHYEGTLRHDDLQATYKCSMDQGTFTLHRITPKP